MTAMTDNSAGAGPAPGAEVTARVIARLEQRVLGEAEPGEQLPSESALAAEFGVSRLTVREAVKSLQARGLVEIRRGRRPTVAYPNARPVGDFFAAAIRRDPRQLLDLLEVRRALEVHIADLAARNAGRADLVAVQGSLDAMRAVAQESPLDMERVNTADVAFHESLAAACGNRLLSFLMEAMERPLHAGRMQSLHGHLARGGTVGDVIDQHAAILERIAAHDPQGAAEAMREHLAQTAKDLRAAFAAAAEPAP
jgi:GntR family transcriptional regulator, transcriptional repressor for pyruvate dehydrogenase complex